MASEFRVGLVATGSAGSQHAIVMANLPGVIVVAGADPKNGIELFDSTKNDPWYITGSKWYADESDMLKQEQIDGLVVSADPLAVGSTVKASVLGQFPARPTLWERPVGFKPEHTHAVQSVSRGATFSVVTFNRFGVASAVRDELQSGGVSLGDIVSFSAFISLSIPEFKRKPWRWDQISCQLPVHLLDHIYDLMTFLGLPAIESVKADVKTEFLWGRSIDRSWAINLKLSNGAVGTITAVQYPQGREFLMPLQKVSLVGTEGALEIQLDHARFIGVDGVERVISMDYSDSKFDQLRQAQQALVRFVVDREGYIDSPATHAAAWAMVLCDWHWVQHSAGNKLFASHMPLGTTGDSCTCLNIGNTIVESARTGSELRIK